MTVGWLLVSWLLIGCGSDRSAAPTAGPDGDIEAPPDSQLVSLPSPLVWEQLPGPYNGQVTQILMHPTGTMFLLAENGIHRSSDLGASWVGIGHPPDTKAGLGVGPDGRLYVVGEFKLYASEDQGSNWSALPVPEARLSAVEVSPQGTLFLLPGFDFIQPPAAYPPARVYRSIDGGHQWTGLTLGDGRSATGLTFTADGAVLAGLDAGEDDFRLLVSRDNGDNWQTLAAFDASIRKVAVGGPGEIYVVLGAVGNELHRSGDGGVSWERIDDGIGLLQAMHVNASGGIWLGTAEGLVVSEDYGRSWRAVVTGFSDIRSLYVNAAGAAYCGLYGDGILRSLDGVEWVQTGLQGLTVWAMIVDAQGAIHLGSHISQDGGANWSVADGQIRSPVRSFAQDGQGHLYAATGRVYRSSDGGRSWSRIEALSSSERIAADEQGRLFVGSNHVGVMRSIDGGHTWERVLAIDDWVRSVFVAADGRVFVGTGQDGLYRSQDGGDTWQRSGAISNVWSMAEADDGALLGGTYSRGVLRSTDGGETWTQTDLAEGGIFSLLSHGGLLFAGNARGKGVFFSADGGRHWGAAGLDVAVTSLAMGPSGEVLAGTHSGISRAWLE